MCISKISTSLCIKDFNKLMYCKTKHKEKKYFCRHFSQYFSEERILIKHIKGCLRINSKKRIKTVGKGSKAKFTNHERQLSRPFIIYAKFEAVLKEAQKAPQEINAPHTNKDHIPCSYAFKVLCIDDRFREPVVIYRRQDAVYRFIDAMLGEKMYYREVIDKQFNKNLVMNKDDKKDFMESNKCWICGRLYAEKDREKMLETVIM